MISEVKRIYLDTCAWCRPFDNPEDKRIAKETNCVTELLWKVDAGKFRITGSSILLAEISMIGSKIKKESVLSLVRYVIKDFAVPTNNTKKLAVEIMEECSVDAMDALHIALSIENIVELFITTDDVILNKAKCISDYNIAVKNPCEV